MNIHEVLGKVKGRRARKRRGQGDGSGQGCTSGRGHKGALARAGWSTRYGYEGGQMPIIRRLPKRGFKNVIFATRYDVVNVRSLEAAFADGETVDLEAVEQKTGVRARFGRLKVLGTGELSTKLNVAAAKFSASARKKIEDAGGSCIVVKKQGARASETP